MAIKHEFDDYVGAVYTRDKDDIYTGNVISMWNSEDKKKAVEMLVKKYNIDLNKSYAYGDTSGDFSMMKMVNNPVCVNPTRKLAEEILNDSELVNRANIIVERKDMIYKLKAKDVNYI